VDLIRDHRDNVVLNLWRNIMDKICAIYCRVSSRRQDARSQLPDLERWAKSCDGQMRWYRDEFTGTTMDRPGWNRLMADVRMGMVDRIVVWRLDRLGRTARGLTALFDELQRRGVGLVSLKDGLDLSTAAGRLMANVLASVAQFETELRAERILAGQAVARAQGKRWGGSKKGARRRVTSEQIDVVRALKAQAKSVAAIARATGLSRPTVYAVLSEQTAMADESPAAAN
jgi:DNA invertase Pin-like site-specific DNA recombinase